MKVAIVSTYDIEGGAARAAFRLHEALRQSGIESEMFVQHRSSNEPGVRGPKGNLPKMVGRIRWQLDQLPAQLAGARRGAFAVNILGGGLRQRLADFAPDVVHLHWVNAGYVSVHELAGLNLPVVWTAHDMWPFTGGCHYDGGCGRFESGNCQPCPMQSRAPSWPVARQRLGAKSAVADRSDITFVAPSRWMASVAARSPVGRGRRIEVIPNGIDLTRFKAIDRCAARDLFGLRQDRLVLLFGGLLSDSDPRKGFQFLDQALGLLAGTEWAQRIELCVFGSASRSNGVIHGIPVRYTGHLHDEESLVALYSASDAFLAPSLQDNLPNTVMEAAACGLPTVAFEVGGMADLVVHGQSGWLAPAGMADGLTQGMVRVAADNDWRVSAGEAARRHAEANFSYTGVATAHAALYRQASVRQGRAP
jgi:glycosyltransferase involved in cell wall biosynthesis